MRIARPGSLFARLLLLFSVVPVVELVLLLWVGRQIGALATIGLIVGTAVLGTWMAHREGRAAWTRFQTELWSGRLPGRALTDGILILIAGAFLLTPGILTDFVGFVLLFPPTRAIVRREVTRRLERRLLGGNGAFTTVHASVHTTTWSRPEPGTSPLHDDVQDVRFEDLDEPGPWRRPPGQPS